MIFILLVIVAIVLFFISFFLIQKQAPFLALIGDKAEQQQFLKNYGFLFILFGILAIIIGIVGNKTLAFLFLVLLILFSGVFSFTLSKKINQKEE